MEKLNWGIGGENPTKYSRLQLVPLVLTEAEGRPAVNSSYVSSINPADGQCLQEKYSNKFSDCSFGLLGNLYACEGKSGKVTSLIKQALQLLVSDTATRVATPGASSKNALSFLNNKHLWLYMNLN